MIKDWDGTESWFPPPARQYKDVPLIEVKPGNVILIGDHDWQGFYLVVEKVTTENVHFQKTCSYGWLFAEKPEPISHQSLRKASWIWPKMPN